MILLNPKQHSREYPDKRSKEIMVKAIEFFEKRGKAKLKEMDHNRVWYSDFLEFVKKERIFSTLLTPSNYAKRGDRDTRWDTWRNCEFNEILAFYGLCYWYTWQVSILGLGPIWMSKNEQLKKKAAQLLEDGAVFAFGLSEREHGADIYSTEMKLIPQADGTYRASGEKYYIGNANVAPMVSTFGRVTDPEGRIAGVQDKSDYVFFAANYSKKNYDLVKNVVNSQNYVGQYALRDYMVTEADILSKGANAWDAALNTVNVGKFNLGWASIGICTHAFYEAINHASKRRLYNTYVTDFPHIKQFFVDAYCRLVAMKLFALRAADYMRSASPKDRRYLLYNPIVKMKVTTQGEEVINLLWEIIAAKGFEGDTYFEMAARDIRGLPKLEGTVHVNMALIIKFIPKFFFGHGKFPPVPKRNDAANDDFLFDQGPAKGLGDIQFHEYNIAYASVDLPNVNVFKDQIEILKEFGLKSPPSPEQTKDIDFLLILGELFTLVAYGQLILENAAIYGVGGDLIDQIFDFMVRDFSKFALQLYSKPSSTKQQMEYAIKMIKKPIADEERFKKVLQQVYALKGLYEMNP
jgi:acyl-CoA dehydrogenase